MNFEDFKKKKKTIVICGPTASGKTALSIALAKLLDGEIVSADSMQIYTELNIGTAKPDLQERAGVPHHMFDVLSCRERYSVSRYETEAAACVEDIFARGKQPIVCGGTGLYINALIHGAGFSEWDDGSLREALDAEWAREGGDAMMAKLAAVDPESAARLHVNDKKRVLRALEVYRLTGKTITAHNLETQTRPPRFDSLFIGICPKDRALLYERIDKRVHVMLEQGLLEEVRRLEAEGLLDCGTAAQAIGYKELGDYLRGAGTLEEGVALIQQKSRNYAKRQLTWFRKDPRVHWIEYDRGEGFDAILQKATDFLAL